MSSNTEHKDLQFSNYEILEENLRIKEDAQLEEFKEMLNEAFEFINTLIDDDSLIHEKLKESFNDNFNGYDFRITDIQTLAKIQSEMLKNTYKG